MNDEVPIDEYHPASAKVLVYLKSHSEKRPRWAPDYYFHRYEMQTRADLEERLYELGRSLPERCDGMRYGYPILVYPRGGVIFAVAMSGSVIILRLPEQSRREALAAGAKEELRLGGQLGYPEEILPISEFGEDWIFIGAWHSDEERLKRLLRASYEYANKLAEAGSGRDHSP